MPKKEVVDGLKGLFMPYSCMNSFGIVSLILSQKIFECNYYDPIGLNITDYLLGHGIYNLLLFTILLIYLIFIKQPNIDHKKMDSIIFFTIINMLIINLFMIIWLILGNIILLRLNYVCIHVHILLYVYVLTTFSMTAAIIIINTIIISQQFKKDPVLTNEEITMLN